VINYKKTWEVMNNLEESFNRIKVVEEMIDDLTQAVNNEDRTQIIDITNALVAYMPVYTSQYQKASQKAWNNTVITAAQEDVPYRRSNWVEETNNGKYKDDIDMELESL
tara:strand:+ start:979 stop:1305 length:327 start_codon:yes stop_codon:yes gene_type:complete